MSLYECASCKVMVTTNGVGHAPGCPECIDDGSEREAERWLASRPKPVKDAVEKYPPSHLYRMKPTGQIVFITRYSENDDGSVTTVWVAVTRKYNPNVLLEREVFGVKLGDLVDIGPPD